MLSRLADFIEKKPRTTIAIIIIITLIFSSQIPMMKTGTSTRDFMPNNEMVRASDRINEYFGKNAEPVMIMLPGKIDGKALKEQYKLIKDLEKINGVDNVIGIANFVASMCGMEYQKNLLSCSNSEIMDAYQDLMSNRKSIMLNDSSDARYPFADIIYARIDVDEKNLNITIHLKNPEVPRYAGVEWYVSFKNKVDPAKLNLTYAIAARRQAQWEVGKGIKSNIESIANSTKAYIWIGRNSRYMDFPINASIFMQGNEIKIVVPREEISRYGIAPSLKNASLPAKLYSIEAGSRVTFPLAISVRTGIILSIIKWIENSFLWKFLHFTMVNLSMAESMLEKKESISFSDLKEAWKEVDSVRSNEQLLIKQPFMEDMRNSALVFESRQKDATLMIAEINGSLTMNSMKKVSREITRMVKTHNENAEITGSTVISYQIDDLTGKSNRIIMPGIFLAIMIILLINFRKPSYMLLSIGGLTIAIIWLFGTMAIVGIKFNTIAVALVPLIMGLGVDYSVHIFHNYLNEIRGGKNVKEAITASIKEVGLALILATITTAVSFLSFLTASVPSVRNFGILAAIGIAYTFIIAITLEAATRYLLDRNKKVEARKSKSKFAVGSIMARLSDAICRHPLQILIVIAIITAGMGLAASRVTTSFSLEEFMPKESPAIKAMEKLPRYFPSAGEDQEYILIEGDVATVDALKGMEKTMEKIKDDSFVARYPDGSIKASSIYSIIEKAAKENSSIKTRFHFKNGMPSSNEDVRALYDYLYNSREYGREVRGVLHKNGNGYDAALIRIYTILTHLENSNEKMKRLYGELKGDASNYGNAKATITGSMVLIYTVMKSLTSSQISSTIVCIIIAGIVVIIAYRKPVLGFLTLLPVIISSTWIMGTIYLAGYTLNVMTVMITSLTIGLGITYAIHVVERFRLIADRTGDVLHAVEESIENTGQAVLMAAITTVAGFAILIFSPMPPEQQFGFITAMTIIYSFITTILVIPPLLLFWGKWRKRRRGYIISPDKPSHSP